MQSDTPEPTVRHRSNRDCPIRGKGHSAGTLPVSPDGDVLKCVVIVSILEIAHPHDTRAPRCIHECVKGDFTGICITRSLCPNSATWPFSIEGQAANLRTLVDFYSLALRVFYQQLIKLLAHYLETLCVAH